MSPIKIEFERRVLTCVVISLGYLHIVQLATDLVDTKREDADLQFSQDGVHVACNLDIVTIGKKRDALDKNIELPNLATGDFFGVK